MMQLGGGRIRIPHLTATFCSSVSSTRFLKVGDVLRESRRFTDSDVVGYSAVSGDRNPVHLDASFAREVGGFERGRVVHGMLIASLFPSPGAIYASQTLQFKLPVYIDDEVVAEVQATYIREMKKRFCVKWSTKCYSSKECLVIDGEATAVLPTLTLIE